MSQVAGRRFTYADVTGKERIAASLIDRGGKRSKSLSSPCRKALVYAGSRGEKHASSLSLLLGLYNFDLWER